jgi:hypothetical protein
MMKKISIFLFTAVLSFAFLPMPAFLGALGGGIVDMAAGGHDGGFHGGYHWKPFRFPILAGRIIPASSPYPDSGFQLAKLRKPHT